MEGRGSGGGIDMLARSEWMSDVPASAYRPFLLDAELELEAEDKLCELVRTLSFGIEGGRNLSRSGSRLLGRGK